MAIQISPDAVYDVAEFLMSEDAANPPQLISGLRKLAQRWLLEFMTESGSLAYQTHRGCDFLIELRRGILQTETDIFQSFAVAERRVRASLKLDEDNTWSVNERINYAVLTNVLIADGLVSLRIRIVSRALQSTQFNLPLSFRLA